MTSKTKILTDQEKREMFKKVDQIRAKNDLQNEKLKKIELRLALLPNPFYIHVPYNGSSGAEKSALDIPNLGNRL